MKETYDQVHRGHPFGKPTNDELIGEHDLSQLHRQVILVRGSILSDRRPDTDRRNRDILPNIFLGSSEVRVKP